MTNKDNRLADPQNAMHLLSIEQHLLIAELAHSLIQIEDKIASTRITDAPFESHPPQVQHGLHALYHSLLKIFNPGQ